MPQLSDEQWDALVTVFVAAWELVDEAAAESRGGNRYLFSRARVEPLREALVGFEIASGGDDPDARVEVRIPRKHHQPARRAAGAAGQEGR